LTNRASLVGVIALLMLASTSLGSTASSPSTADAGRSASQVALAASGQCSKAEATALVKRLRLGAADLLPNPVYQVICGAFMGPSSQTMVALLASGGASAPHGGWAAFRLLGGTWQLVTEHTGGGRITAAGADLRETVSVMREGDSHCCPTGGTKARLWHWNGTRFTASAWKQITPAAAPTGSFKYGFFKTPSGNILCGYAYDKNAAHVECVVKSGLKPPPPPRRPACSPTIVVRLNATGRVQTAGSVCPGEDAPETPYVGSGIAKVLGYGKTWSGGGLSCTSAVIGLTCRNNGGHGFFLSRERWRAF
jgi:hypothetical protein